MILFLIIMEKIVNFIIFFGLMASRVLSSVVCSTKQTQFISNDGDIYLFGGYGPSDKEEDIDIPKKLEICFIISIACASRHTVCLDKYGNVFTFGSVDSGQLGIAKEPVSFDYTLKPQKVNVPLCKQVSCGETFTICLTESGDLYSFGYGELGLGKITEALTPQKIESLKDIDFVDCGYNHTICKTLNGEIYAWGNNDYGQLGTGNQRSRYEPYLCSDYPDNIVDIKCSFYFTLILTSNKELLSSGNNYYGQLGRCTLEEYGVSMELAEEISNIIRIECGDFHSMCIDVNEDLFVFGANEHGQLGFNTGGYNETTATKHPSLSNIIDISKGGYHTFAKTSNNEIYAFGNNEHSQLGATTENLKQITPIRVFEDKEDIWCSNIKKSKAKSARK